MSKGLGDTVEMVIKAVGLDKLVDGKDCGCSKRKAILNKIVPYYDPIQFYTVCQDIVYFHWQTEVFLTNFLEHGLEDINIVYLVKGRPSKELVALMRKYPTVNWYPIATDKRNKYLAVNWFTGLRLKNPQGWIFYHDADMIFIKKPNIEFLSKLDRKKAYGSDTRSYNSSAYIRSRSEDVFVGMCNIVGIDPEIVAARDHQVVGAQWIFPGMSVEFWSKVERDAQVLYNFIASHPSQQYELVDNVKVHPVTNKPAKLVQNTAAMWAILWNFWKAGVETEILPELEFSFATAPAHKCTNILHNAGVANRNQTKMFAKLNYVNSSPIGQELNFDPAFAAYKYSEAIKKVK